MLTWSQKRSLSVAIVAAILLVGIVFQALYDGHAKVRRERVRKNYFEIKKREPTEGWVTNLFFYVRKARTWEEVDRRSRELIQRI